MADNERPEGKIIITLESEEKSYEFSDLDVKYDSTPEEILAAVQPPVLEDYGINIESDFVVKKMENTGNVKIFPKSVAGIA